MLLRRVIAPMIRLFFNRYFNRLGLRKIGRKIHPLFQLNRTSFLYRSSFPSSPTEYSYSSSIQTRDRIRKRPLMQELSLLKREGEREGERHEGNYLNRYVDSCARTTRLPGCIDDLSSPAKYLYISGGMYFGPADADATTRWRRPVRSSNLELMNVRQPPGPRVLSYSWTVTLEDVEASR